MFTKGQRVIKILKVGPLEVGTIDSITKATKHSVQLSRDEHLRYDSGTGEELNPAPGFARSGISSRIIAFDGD